METTMLIMNLVSSQAMKVLKKLNLSERFEEDEISIIEDILLHQKYKSIIEQENKEVESVQVNEEEVIWAFAAYIGEIIINNIQNTEVTISKHPGKKLANFKIPMRTKEGKTVEIDVLNEVESYVEGDYEKGYIRTWFEGISMGSVDIKHPWLVQKHLELGITKTHEFIFQNGPFGEAQDELEKLWETISVETLPLIDGLYKELVKATNGDKPDDMAKDILPEPHKRFAELLVSLNEELAYVFIRQLAKVDQLHPVFSKDRKLFNRFKLIVNNNKNNNHLKKLLNEYDRKNKF